MTDDPGRVYNDAEVQAHSAAAAAEMREAIREEEKQLARILVAAELMQEAAALGPDWVATIRHGLDRLGLSDALARMLAAERRAGMERALSVAAEMLARKDMDCASCCGPSAKDDEFPDYLREAEAAIRARMEDTNGTAT